MTKHSPVTIHRKDYTAPAYWVDTVEMGFDLDPVATRVATRITMRRNCASPNKDVELLGDGVKLVALRMNGKTLSKGAKGYTITDGKLRIANAPDEITLEIETLVQPEKNTSMMGLYISNGNFFTQCEPEGFRKITWFPDRPDVMAKYTVMLRGDKKKYPVLLSNGNLIEQGDLPKGRHYAKWEDPFKKPSYLFALVAGKLVCQEETFKLDSGRKVLLQVWVETGNLDKTQHAMASLKRSIRWDQQRYGLELDLDRFMIVAVGDFNMGAMENKGLNIFNTKYVLANPSIATDTDYANIEAVVGHEYFHNWTGNRVTCRDWFQLSLKEGLTVFRDQEFGADTHSRETARIREVRGLRAAQFPEDAGPMAHSVRPESYVEINNFYTATVYEKGAEVVRMIQTLIGEVAFRRGMDLYFARHDGQAVTCEDFVAAMGDAAGFDFAPFMIWYRQAGTPIVRAHGAYDAETLRYTLTLAQSCPPTPAQAEKEPYLIPVAVGLLGPDGRDFDLGGSDTTCTPTHVLHLSALEQVFVFENIPAPPIPSLLRNFSAPVLLEYAYAESDLAHLLAHDSDAFNRWEAGQRLFGQLIRAAVERLASGESAAWPVAARDAVRKVLVVADDPAFIAEALTLPGEATLAEQMAVVDPELLHHARTGLARFLASGLESDFVRLYDALAPNAPYRPETVDAGRRRRRNLCLAYLNELDIDEYRQLVRQQIATADNMTDQFAALSVLVNAPPVDGSTLAAESLAEFFARWQHEALVVDKWLAVQAGSRLPGTLARVEQLTRHAAFERMNPNKIYALIRTFGANHRHFHAADGSGYRFLAAQIAGLDPVNPQVAARLARCFDRWRRFDAAHQTYAQAALESIRQTPGLSRDVFEVVEKTLA
ncbi:MAG: aminopeptidase N [Propionivibrio sp.]